MLTIFRRHLKACPQTSRRYRRCQCPIWIEATLGLEDVPRRSLNLTFWDAAEDYVRESDRTYRQGRRDHREADAHRRQSRTLSD